MSFGRYTTPTITLTFTEQSLDLTTARNVYVTFSSNGYKLTKTDEDLQVTEKTISVWLTQAETGRFREEVEVQANWTANGGMRYQSFIQTIPVDRNLLERVVE